MNSSRSLPVDHNAIPALPEPTYRIEGFLWSIAILTFGVGDIVTTCIGQHIGLFEVNPILRTLFAVGPVFVVMLLSAFVQLGLAYVVASRITSPARLLIPATFGILGIRVVLINVEAILSFL